MCTVTFVPLKSGAYFLTSNRDEYTSRSKSHVPKREEFNNYDLIYPKDPKGGGTWMATDNRGITVCLLNGANTPHEPVYPYRHSRGLVVLDFFKFNSYEDFIQFYDLNNIEPFTLVILTQRELIEFKWNGSVKSFTNISIKQPRIWSSVTLYNPEIVTLRETWFDKWILEHQNPDVDEMIHFHKFAGEGDKKIDVLMEREAGLKTVSITSVFHQHTESSIYYEDLIDSKIEIESMEYLVNHDS